MSSVTVRFGAALVALLGAVTLAKAQLPTGGDSPSGIISGHVTIDGNPAPRAIVIVESFNDPTNAKLPKAFTDQEGNYRLTGVPEGRFVVRVVAPSFVAAEGAGANQAGTRLSSNNGLIGYILSVAGGDVIEGVNFELTRGGVITGRVTDSEGKPVIGAQVSCSRIERNGSSGAGERAETDDRGVYRIYGLPAGDYMVSVSGVTRGRRRYRQTFYTDAASGARATPVAVAAGGESRGIDIRLGQPEKSYAVRERVIDEESDRPVPGVSLSFRGLDRSAAGTQGFVTTDGEGRFEVEGYAPGRYELQVTFTGGPNQGYYSDPLTFEVMDADVKGLEVKATRGAIISGSVVVEGGNNPALLSRLSGLSAEQVQPEGEAGTDGRPLFLSTLIGPGGSFEFSGVRPGRTRINVNGLPEGFQLMRVERDGIPVTSGMNVSPGERVGGVRVVLAYGTGSIRGQARVIGSLPTRYGWVLEVRRVGGELVRAELLDASGLFWVKGLARGSYEVTATLDYAEAPGLTPPVPPAPVKQLVAVEDGAQSRVLLELDLGKARKN